MAKPGRYCHCEGSHQTAEGCPCPVSPLLIFGAVQTCGILPLPDLASSDGPDHNCRNIVTMFDKLKPALHTLLHTVMGIKMNSTTIVPEVLPKFPEHIESYCEKLAAMKKGDGIEHLKEWRVEYAMAYKIKTMSRHEYISVAVVDIHNKTHHLVIERMAGDSHSPYDTNTNFQSEPRGLLSSNPSISSTSSVSSSLDFTCSADDRIGPLPSRMRNKTDTLIYELHFNEEKPLYLYHLAILALVVHKVNPDYLLTTNNCYHYAGIIMKSLEKEYQTLNIAEGAEAGLWCGVDIYSRQKGNVSSLLENFKECVEKFVSFIHILSN